MSWHTLPHDQAIEIDIVSDCILTSDPRNTTNIFFAVENHDPEILSPGARVRLRGRGTLEMSARDLQRYRIDENIGFRMTEASNGN